MTQTLVDAYDPRHPEHEALLNLHCDTGLDIELLPNFEVMVVIQDSPASDKNMPPGLKAKMSGKKRKSLAQLPYGSKEWDDEMERQQPGWCRVHVTEQLL